MLSGRLFVGKRLQKDIVFDETSVFNRDNVLLPYIILRECFRETGIGLVTQDRLSASKSLFDIYVNNLPATELPPDRSFLLVRESPLIRPDNFAADLRGKYAKVFSWSKSHKNVNNSIFTPLPKLFPSETRFSVKGRKKSAVIIAGNKKSDSPGELYSYRDDVIQKFQTKDNEKLDLYGQGWDLPVFTNSFLRRVSVRLPWLFRVFHQPPSIYRGSTPKKDIVLRKYWFSICLENTDIDPEYISEKIFDSIFAGTVPLYYGAQNIAKYVPRNLFLQIKPDDSIDQIMALMESIDLSKYEKIQGEMSAFIERERKKLFSPEYFASTIVSNVLSVISR